MVSIIVPVYNVAQYLERCLDSLAGQTYRDVEIICVDDGSTDSSSALLDAYAERDERLVVVHKKNGGVSSARNEGLQRAAGRYVAFVDPDDTVELNMVELMMDALVQSGADFAVSGYWDCDENDVPQAYHGPTRVDKKLEGYQELTPMTIARRLPYSCMKMYRRSIIEQAGLRFDETIRIGEDYIFDLQYLMHSRTVYYVNEGLYHYCHRQDSCLGQCAAGRFSPERYKAMIRGRRKLFAQVPASPPGLTSAQWRTQVFCGVLEACKIAWAHCSMPAGIPLMLYGAVEALRSYLMSPKVATLSFVCRMLREKRI